MTRAAQRGERALRTESCAVRVIPRRFRGSLGHYLRCLPVERPADPTATMVRPECATGARNVARNRGAYRAPEPDQHAILRAV